VIDDVARRVQSVMQSNRVLDMTLNCIVRLNLVIVDLARGMQSAGEFFSLVEML